MTSDERAKLQTVEEWLEEYNAGKPVYPATALKDSSHVTPKAHSQIYIFDSHRTTRDSRLVLSFVDEKTDSKAIMWINVDINRKRGEQKGKQYATGEGGQFSPLKRGDSKFRKFWMEVVGKEPYRWSLVHRELKSKLKGLRFNCETKISYDKQGKPYTEITNFTLENTNQAQKLHNSSTKTAQENCTRHLLKAIHHKSLRDFKVPSNKSTQKPSYPRTQ